MARMSRLEFEGYKELVTSDSTLEILHGDSPDAISKLGADMAVYYARVACELAVVKDMELEEFLRLTKSKEDGGLGMKIGEAEKMAESNVNKSAQVSRRDLDYLMKGMDAIKFAAQSRITSFKKEGNY